MNLNDIKDFIVELKEDGVPKNVARQIDQITACFNDSTLEDNCKVHKALTILDEIANDSNLASHLRTQIMNVSSMLESSIKN
jgi:uncharacterized protein (UPF0147 family)